MKTGNEMKNPARENLPSAVFKVRADMMRILVAGLAAGCFCIPAAQAATAGQITHLSGTLSAKKADGSSKLLAVKSDVAEGDTLSTEAETYARVKFADGGEVVLRPGTQLKIESYAYNAARPEGDSIVMSMFKGGLRAVTGLIGKRSREKVSFATETATIGIRGTHFGALLVPERLRRRAHHRRHPAGQRPACGRDHRFGHHEQSRRHDTAQPRAVRFCRQFQYRAGAGTAATGRPGNRAEFDLEGQGGRPGYRQGRRFGMQDVMSGSGAVPPAPTFILA
jgi:hypothetical protein